MPVNIKLGLGINSGGGARFTPKKISGLALWLDASDLSTITKDGSNYVSQWNDKSGKGFNVVQATGSAQPLWASNTIAFNGVVNGLVSATNLDVLKNKSGGTFIIVGKLSTGIGTGKPLVIVTINGSAVASRLSVTSGDSVASAVRAGGRRLDANTFAGTVQEAVTLDTNYIFTGIADYANAKAYMYVNNVLESTLDPFQTAGNTSDTAANAISIGSNNDLSVLTKCVINEVILYEKVLTSNELSRVNQYLSRKWSVTI